MVGTSQGCPAGTAACDSNPSNGCETNTNTDNNNCGGCGKKCTFQNGTGTCVNGLCAITACNAGYADCDLNPDNGCETNTLTDPMHCGTSHATARRDHYRWPSATAATATSPAARPATPTAT